MAQTALPAIEIEIENVSMLYIVWNIIALTCTILTSAMFYIYKTLTTSISVMFLTKPISMSLVFISN